MIPQAMAEPPSIHEGDSDVRFDLLREVLGEHPELFWANRGRSYIYDDSGPLTLSPTHLLAASEIPSMRDAHEARAAQSLAWTPRPSAQYPSSPRGAQRTLFVDYQKTGSGGRSPSRTRMGSRRSSRPSRRSGGRLTSPRRGFRSRAASSPTSGRRPRVSRGPSGGVDPPEGSEIQLTEM